MKLRQLISIVLLSLGLMTFAASEFSAKSELDSVYLLMGKQTRLHVNVVGPLSETGGIVAIDSMWKDVEIISMGEPKINDLGDIIIQSFDSGMYTLPPVIYLQEGETIFTNRPVLKVIPVAVDSMVTVHDYADVADVNRHFFDYFPDWVTDYGAWILLTLAGIAISLFIYLKWLRKGQIPLIPAKKPVPPYQLAIQRLEELRNEHLCERGEEKEYYTRLTDILRSYLDKRFGINAMEMTSTQIKNALRSNEATRLPERYMTRILEIADFVKFAKVRPLPDDNEQAFRSAMQFVEDTKPEETPDTDDSKPIEVNNKID